jgi:hypothetical protein
MWLTYVTLRKYLLNISYQIGKKYIHCMCVVVIYSLSLSVSASKMLKILIWTEQEDMCLVHYIVFERFSLSSRQFSFLNLHYFLQSQKTWSNTALWNHVSSFITATENCKRSVESKIVKQYIINPLLFHLDLMYPYTVILCNLKVCFMLSSMHGLAKGYECAIHALSQWSSHLVNWVWLILTVRTCHLLYFSERFISQPEPIYDDISWPPRFYPTESWKRIKCK